MWVDGRKSRVSILHSDDPELIEKERINANLGLLSLYRAS